MHILLVTTSYPESQSGSEAAGAFIEEFARQLTSHARVTVVAAAGGGSSQQAEGALQVRRFAVSRWPLSLLSPTNPLDWWPIWSTVRDGMNAVREVVETDRPDYILALWALPSGYWARSMLQDFGVPYGVWALGSDIWSLGRVPVLRSFLRRVLADAEDRYADGLQLGKEVEKIGGAPCDFLPSARRLVANGERNVAESAPYRLAFLGRWHPNKGVDLFVEALSQLSDDDWHKISEVRLRGGGPLESDVHQAVEHLQSLGRPVDIGGYLDTEQAIELLTWTDYLVLPSRVESIPVIFSDAAWLGRPLVATPVGDLPRLFELNEFGVLANAATADAIANAIREALATPASRFNVQLEALARQFDIEKVAQDFARRVAVLEKD
jgi:glycosyltransferase involved in cell wall biosynthesis